MARDLSRVPIVGPPRPLFPRYQDLFGIPMISEVIHAGLECGYIIDKYPDMEVVSIGPTLEDVHTTRERLYVPSLEKIVQLLAEVMKRS